MNAPTIIIALIILAVFTAIIARGVHNWKNGLRCFPEPRRVGAVVCCPRRLSLCTMQLPEARFGPSVRRGLGAERPSWLKGHGWGWAQKAFARRILLPHEGEPVGSGFRAPENPA